MIRRRLFFLAVVLPAGLVVAEVFTPGLVEDRIEQLSAAVATDVEGCADD